MQPSVVETLVQAAWRRRLVVLTAEQLALALLVVFSGLIVLLLIGTQILSWYWLLPLAMVGLAISAWRVRQRFLARYEVARLLDYRLQLNDTVSTAWYLLSGSASAGENPVARYQLRQAEQIAAAISPETAFPIIVNRMWIAVLALLAVIGGLFTARYLVNSSLSLRPALIRLSLPSSRGTLAAEAAERGDRSKPESLKSDLAREILPETRDGRQESPSQVSPMPKDQQDARSDQKTNGQSQSKSSSQSSQPQDGQQSTSSKDQSQSGNQSDSNSPATDSKSSQNSKEANNGKDDERRGQSKTADGQQTPGLMDKMRDALSSLMAKMQRGSAKDSSSRDGKSSNSGAQKGQSQENAANKQNAAPDQNGQKSESSLDSQSSAQAAAVEKTPASSMGTSNEQMQQSKSNDPQSGAGRQDGQKDIKQAEQLRAMGKLAEIIGKRSASLTGEIKVEKPSGEQQLQTQYSNQVGRHSDSGGEINRDEVPLEYQNYVRAYMKEVHKQAEAKAP